MKKRNKGFTLIELLVVITIIAVLAAILFPVFLMARAKARSMSCIANLKQFGSVFAMYQGDWEGRFPYTAVPVATYSTLGCSISASELATPWWRHYSELWTVKLEPYVNYMLMAQYGPEGDQIYKPQGIMKCKETDGKIWELKIGTRQDEAGYGYNFLYLGLPFKAWYQTGETADNPYYGAGYGKFIMGAAKLSSIKAPGDTILLVENQFVWAFPPTQNSDLLDTPTKWADAGKKTIGNQFIRPRHGAGLKTTVLWCDGHVTTMDTRYLVYNGCQFGDKLIPRGSTKSRGQERVQSGVARNNSLWDLQ